MTVFSPFESLWRVLFTYPVLCIFFKRFGVTRLGPPRVGMEVPGSLFVWGDKKGGDVRVSESAGGETECFSSMSLGSRVLSDASVCSSVKWGSEHWLPFYHEI